MSRPFSSLIVLIGALLIAICPARAGEGKLSAPFRLAVESSLRAPVIAVAAAGDAADAAGKSDESGDSGAADSSDSSDSSDALDGPTATIVEGLQRYAGAIVEINTTAISDGETLASLGARRSGSGVILDPTTVLTVDYLLLEADQVEIVTASGQKVPGSVAGYDYASGLGVVRVALPLDGPALELGDSDAIGERDKVFTRGHDEPVASELLVVARKPFVGGWEYLVECAIFTFPPVNNWAGAALMTADGKLVGIGSLIVNDAAEGDTAVPGNMFVPVDLLKPILADLLTKGRREGPARPWLGAVTDSVRGNLMISQVTSNSPAEKAGLAPGDIILGVGGTKITDQADFYRRVWQTGSAGSIIPLRVLHAGTLIDIPVRSIDLADFLRKPGGI